MPEINFYLIGLDKPLETLLEQELPGIWDCLVLKNPGADQKPEENSRTLHILVVMENCAGADFCNSNQLNKIIICNNETDNSVNGNNSASYCYMTSPFRLGAFIDQCNRMIRTHERLLEIPPLIELGIYDFLPREYRLVIKNDGREIRLTDKERDILLALYHNKDIALDRKTLLQDVWGFVDGVETHTLETHIYRLRKKIEPEPARPEYIITSGNGYKLGLQ